MVSMNANTCSDVLLISSEKIWLRCSSSSISKEVTRVAPISVSNGSSLCAIAAIPATFSDSRAFSNVSAFFLVSMIKLSMIDCAASSSPSEKAVRAEKLN